jgi:hypothetical protein
MTLRMPGAVYMGPPDSNWGGSIIRPPMGQVTHIAQGSYQGTISWQRNPVADVSSYFVVSYSGEIAQMLDLDLMAWTQAQGNPWWIGVENEGYSTQPLTDPQVSANARIFAFIRSVWPTIPAQVTNSVNVAGLGWHGMGGAAWGSHPDCPGAVNVALLPIIVARATGATPQGAGVSYILQQGASLYVVPGGLTKNGKIGVVAMYGDTMAAHQAVLPVVALQVGTTLAAANYEVASAWPDCSDSGGGVATAVKLTPEGVQQVEDAAYRGANRAEDS